jgi:prepilin-type processing-associated H-X9-DG protein
VVIAIISILAAMLLPALEGALDTARQVQCLNNLHQTAMGINFYLDDHSGLAYSAYPGHDWGGNNWGHQPTSTPGLWHRVSWKPGWYPEGQGAIAYGPGLLLTGGYVDGYEEIKTGQLGGKKGKNEGQRPVIWCPYYPGRYKRIMRNLTMAGPNESMMDLNGYYKRANWKAVLGAAYPPSVTGNKTQLIFTSYTTRAHGIGPRDAPSKWALMWDWESTSKLSTYYWSASWTEIMSSLAKKHQNGYNVLFYDGHCEFVGDRGRYLIQKWKGQGRPGLNNTTGTLRLYREFQ